MASPYNTRSTSSAASASSITIIPPTVATPNPRIRHFCIVLTNNPRMIQSAGRMLQNVTVSVAVSTPFVVVNQNEKKDREFDPCLSVVE